MARFEINVPYWKIMGVGLAETMLRGQEWVDVDVLYKNKTGKRQYPNTFWFDAREAHKYKQDNRNGTLLRLIPFSAMTTNKPKEHNEKL